MPDILRLPPAPVPERGRPKISHLVYFCGRLRGPNHISLKTALHG